MNLNDFLVWLTGGGAIIAISWLFERWAWFQAQTANLKQMLVFGSSAALSIGAWAVVTYVPADVLSQIAPVFAILAATFVSVFLGQMFHAIVKKQ
jgi:hypothetical protein